MGFGSRAFLAGGLGFAAAFVVACGGSNGLLSANENSSLTSQLNSISAAVQSHQCGQAASAAAALTNAVANLPPSVTTTLVKNLGQGAGTVSQLAGRDCTTTTTASTKSSTSTSTSSSSTPTTSSSSSSSSSTPTSTSTSPTSSTSTGATNPAAPGTSTTSNGGVAPSGTGTAPGPGNGNGGNGNGGNGNGGNGK